MAKPTVIPEFASSDLTDPTSGENNVVEPITAAKTYGWTPYLTKPFRTWMNWLHRYYYLWIKWLNDELDPAVTQNAADIATNASNISTNATNISNNTSNISTNTTNISTNALNISTNATNISSNDSDISDIENYFADDIFYGVISTSYLTVQRTIAFPYSRVFIDRFTGQDFFMLNMALTQDEYGVSNSNDLQIAPQTTWPSFIANGQTLPIILLDDGDVRAGNIYFPTSTSGNMILKLLDPTDNIYKTNIFTSSGNKGIIKQTLSLLS